LELLARTDGGLDKASQKKSKKTKLVPSYPDRHMEWSTVGAAAGAESTGRRGRRNFDRRSDQQKRSKAA
jgi:hypothetical protein